MTPTSDAAQSESVPRLLITGARGFIGRHVVPLATAAYDVHAVSSAVVPSDHGAKVTWHRVDVLDPAQVAAVLQATRPTHLLHLAWYTEPGLYWQSHANLQWVRATLDLLQGFQQMGGRRFVGIGTCAEYALAGDVAVEGVTAEGPNTLYGECKLATGRIALRFGSLAGVRVAWARLFYLFGPGERGSRFIASLAGALVRGTPFVCRHSDFVRDYLYVRDVADALVQLLGTDVTGAINIASGIPLRLDEFARLFGERAQRPDLIRFATAPVESAEPKTVLADVHRLMCEVGWRPRVSLTDATDETIAWWSGQARHGLQSAT